MSYDNNGPHIAQGRYRARAVQGGLGMTSKGNPQVAVEFELLDEDWAGERITWFGGFNDESKTGKGKTQLDFTLAALRAAGWTGDDLSNLEGLGSTEVSIVVKHEEYEGKMQARVQWVNAPGGLALKSPMSPEAASAFAARMKGRVMRAAPPPSRPATSSAPAPRNNVHPNAPGSGVDDDIPF